MSTVATDAIPGAQDDWLDDMLTRGHVADGVVVDMLMVLQVMVRNGETKLSGCEAVGEDERGVALLLKQDNTLEE